MVSCPMIVGLTPDLGGSFSLGLVLVFYNFGALAKKWHSHFGAQT